MWQQWSRACARYRCWSAWARPAQAQGDVVLPSLPNEAATETNEGATVNNIDGDFGAVTLSPKRFAMRMDLSRQLLVQSAANLDTVIQADMTNAIANKLDESMIGDIFSQLATAGNITDGSAGSGTSATATDYLGLTNHEGGFLSQNPSGQNLAMLMDPTMASFLKQVSQSTGGAILNSGNEILGYPVFTSTNATTQTVVAKTTFKEEFVTCGGVTLGEVDFNTMESRVVPGLHFAGEVLDVDGITGGFNFQAAWTTGFMAGRLGHQS